MQELNENSFERLTSSYVINEFNRTCTSAKR